MSALTTDMVSRDQYQPSYRARGASELVRSTFSFSGRGRPELRDDSLSFLLACVL